MNRYILDDLYNLSINDYRIIMARWPTGSFQKLYWGRPLCMATLNGEDVLSLTQKFYGPQREWYQKKPNFLDIYGKEAIGKSLILEFGYHHKVYSRQKSEDSIRIEGVEYYGRFSGLTLNPKHFLCNNRGL